MSRQLLQHNVLFVISTGRCGTQWLAKALDHTYADCASVTHEPLGPHYSPKTTLRAPAALREIAGQEPLAGHLAHIDAVVRDRAYIECGWPAFALIPLLVERYGARLRVVHLVRHPVSTALSYLSHNFYRPEARDDAYIRMAQLEPTDPGIKYSLYQEIWPQLSAYEKALFQWLEINSWAEELKSTYSSVPVCTIRMEDLFSKIGETQVSCLTGLAGLPWREELGSLLTRRVDAYQRPIRDDFDWRRVHRHPKVIELAGHYGYNFKFLGLRLRRVWSNRAKKFRI